MLSSTLTGASVVSADIEYQIFRDFAENKGMFRPGTKNIEIYNKQGNLVGTLDKAIMPDFSSVDSEIGVATLIDPQYIVSVKHNGGYKNVSFGDGENKYNIVDRNEHGSQDFHAPRLDKLVTEVAPATITEEGQKQDAYKNTERYTAFYRLGSGVQYIKDQDGNLTQLGGAYNFLTGGTIGTPLLSDHSIVSNPGLLFNPENGPLASYGTPGDSGSPLFAYDSVLKKWVLVGVLRAYAGESGHTSWFTVIPTDFVTQQLAQDYDAPVTFNTTEGGSLEWTFDSNNGTGALKQGNATYAMHGQKGSDLNAGKNLLFQGQSGQIDLKDSVSQGAGSLTFRDDYTVTTSNGSTWTGAGIIVEKDASVNWQINGVKGDNLHKIGEGTLIIQGTGINEGGLKVGDGKVILNQQVDTNGKVQAFSSLNIASGRAIVVLADDKQINTDNISWGYRGGILDINGNDLTFRHLKAADYGAVLANTNNAERSAVSLDFTSGKYLYHGQFKGNMDVTNESNVRGTDTLVLDGSADISGTFTQKNGRLTLQGHPVIHAYTSQSVADKLAETGDNSVVTQPTSFDQDDWENRTFSFGKLLLSKTDFGLGRNATLQTTIEATDSTITLGDSRVFIDKKDGDGTAFVLNEGTSVAMKDTDRSMFTGSAVLNGKTKLHITNAFFSGDITGNNGSYVELLDKGHWEMTKSSTLDSFSSKGGTLSMITDNWSPKNLTVRTMDASNLRIAMGVSTEENTSDRIDILKMAKGGNNSLDLSSLFGQTVTLKNDLTLASAPAGTAHDYFSFTTMSRGFTLYTPDTQVQEKDGKVIWQLKGSAPDVPDVPDVPEENTETTVNGSTLFKGDDNNSLLKKTRAMFAAREFILDDSADRWQLVVDNSNADGGIWAMTGYSHGGYAGFTLNQSGLNIGFRQPGIDGTWWGIGTELYRGHSSTDNYQDDFSLWGGHILAGKQLTGNIFIDGMAGYRELSEEYTIQGELNDLSGKVKSHILTAGIRTGWKTYFSDIDMTITPTVSLNGAWLDGNRLHGLARRVELHGGSALWLKAGVETEKKISDGLTLKVGGWKNISLSDMPGVTLSDDWKARHYGAEKIDRYTTSLSVHGKLTERLSVQAKMSSSFGGYFQTDAEGMLGIRYDF